MLHWTQTAQPHKITVTNSIGNRNKARSAPALPHKVALLLALLLDDLRRMPDVRVQSPPRPGLLLLPPQRSGVHLVVCQAGLTTPLCNALASGELQFLLLARLHAHSPHGSPRSTLFRVLLLILDCSSQLGGRAIKYLVRVTAEVVPAAAIGKTAVRKGRGQKGRCCRGCGGDPSKRPPSRACGRCPEGEGLQGRCCTSRG